MELERAFLWKKYFKIVYTDSLSSLGLMEFLLLYFGSLRISKPTA